MHIILHQNQFIPMPKFNNNKKILLSTHERLDCKWYRVGNKSIII